MNFSPSKYASLKARLRRRYQTQLRDTLKNLRKVPDFHISSWLRYHHQELKDYSPINWLFLSGLQHFSFFSAQSEGLGKQSFGAAEELVFEKWNNSEFADVFLKSLNMGLQLGKASRRALKDFDSHLKTFGERHILKYNSTSKSYRIQTSLGEYAKDKKVLRLLETTLHLEGKDLRLMTMSLKDMKIYSQRIEIALKVIKKFSPTSWERFVAFTDVIIPIKQEQLVSYSHQDLPGHSMINLFHRDFVDLMDDLLHENGHHHLNYYLNLGKLIDEPTENIYYSPWRRTLRPLRGIFHAYFTFFWAFKLFSDLAKSGDVDSIFYLYSPVEKEKIVWRAIEEFYMLDYTYKELKWARKGNLIKDAGWLLIEEQQSEVRKLRKYIPRWEKLLKAHKTELKTLKQTLALAEKNYLRK